MPARTISAWQQDDDVQAHVLVEREKLVGYGELWFDAEEDEVELARIIVAPEARGRGSAACSSGVCSHKLTRQVGPMSSCACTRTTRRL